MVIHNSCVKCEEQVSCTGLKKIVCHFVHSAGVGEDLYVVVQSLSYTYSNNITL